MLNLMVAVAMCQPPIKDATRAMLSGPVTPAERGRWSQVVAGPVSAEQVLLFRGVERSMNLRVERELREMAAARKRGERPTPLSPEDAALFRQAEQQDREIAELLRQVAAREREQAAKKREAEKKADKPKP